MPSLVYAHPLTDRERRLFWLLFASWIVNVVDLALSAVAMEHQVLVEMNPLAAMIVPHGVAAIAVYKFTLLIIGTTIFWACRTQPITERCAWAYAAVCVALSLWWHHVYATLGPMWITLTQAAAELPA